MFMLGFVGRVLACLLLHYTNREPQIKPRISEVLHAYGMLPCPTWFGIVSAMPDGQLARHDGSYEQFVDGAQTRSMAAHPQYTPPEQEMVVRGVNAGL
jgi:hypothetical protein